MAERFWAFVNKGDADVCWEWSGCRKRRYGNFQASSVSKQAHRVAWELQNGVIPDGMSVLHRCDNPPCVNPEHLFLGTQQDNMDDMKRKGRRLGRMTGESNHAAMLSADDVIDVLVDRWVDGQTAISIARQRSVSRFAIYNVSTGKRYMAEAVPTLFALGMAGYGPYAKAAGARAACP